MTVEKLIEKLKQQTKTELIELLIKVHSAGDKNIKEMIEAKKIDPQQFYSSGDIVELIVVRPLNTALQCKILKTGEKVTLRKNEFEIPGETITVEVSKHWKNRNTTYMSGKKINREFNISHLNLQPLSIRKYEPVSRSEFMLSDEEPKELRDLYKSLFPQKEYTQYEMESIVPGYDNEDIESDPIYMAVELMNLMNDSEAIDILLNLLEKDLRCIDAYSYLGDIHLPADENSPYVDTAIGYYKAGVTVGDFFLGTGFDGLLPWNATENRPFLRSLYGYGYCLMKSSKKEDALAVFLRMLKFDPNDSQGVRFLIEELKQ